MQIEYRGLEELTKYEYNSREHSEEQVLQIVKSIKEFGFTNPILIDEKDEIIAGHGRLLASEKLSLKEVPVIVLSHLTDMQKKAYIIADNKLSENASWNIDMLKSEIETLGAFDFDIELLGFNLEELGNLDIDLEFGGSSENSSESDGENGDGFVKKDNEIDLFDRFIIPPFSVIRTTSGEWLERRAFWKDDGLKRGGGRNSNMQKNLEDLAIQHGDKGVHLESSESEFDPVLVEVILHWFNIKEGSVLDPFAGGSTRGIISELLGHKYTGFEIRKEQIDFNIKNAKIDFNIKPKYILDSSERIGKHCKDESFDLVFSCPPYANLEVYSDLKEDISNMEYSQFLEVYKNIISECYKALKNERFAVFVVGEVRGKDGVYYNFVGDTIQAFIKAGFHYYNEIILINAIGTKSLVAGKHMTVRKIGKIHQNILVFYKGDRKNINKNIKNNFDSLLDKYETEYDTY